MKNLLILFLAFFTIVFAQAQSPILNWAKIYQGNAYSVDSSSVMKMYEGDKSVYIGATSDAFGTANDILLIKRDYLTGDTLWTRRYNGAINGDDQFVDMVINQNTGDIYITGKSKGYGTGYDIVTIKYSKNGNIIWSRTWDNILTHGDDFPSSIGMDFNGNIYVSGSTFNNTTISWNEISLFDVIILVYDSYGKIFIPRDEISGVLYCSYFSNISDYYSNKITYYSNDYVKFMKINNVGHIYISGDFSIPDSKIYSFYQNIKKSNTLSPYYLSNISNDYAQDNGNGWYFDDNIISMGDEVHAMELDNSSNIYIASSTIAKMDEKKYLSVDKLESNGKYIYHNNIIINDKTKECRITNMRVDSNGNLYAVGYEENNQKNHDWFVKKLNESGNSVWKITLTGKSKSDKAVDLGFDSMQNPVVVGTTKNSEGNNEILIVKLDKNTGNQVYTETYKKENWSATPFNIIIDSKNNIIVNGTVKQKYVTNILTLKYSGPIADAGNISGKINLCQGDQNVTYTVPLIENAATYSWSLPSGSTGSSITNSIIVSYGSNATTGSITVKGKNTFGEGKPSSLSITVIPMPNIFAGNDTSVCAGSSIVLKAIGNGNVYSWDNGVIQSVSFTPSSTKEYTVNTSNGLCSNTDKITVTVRPKPDAPLIYLADNAFYSTIPSGNLWYNNGVFVSLGTSNIYTPQKSGNYYATVIQNNCESLPSNAINYLKTSFKEFQSSNEIVIYPNPSTGIFTINLNKELQSDFEVKVFTGTGTLIKTITKLNTKTDLNVDLSKYPVGIYLLQIMEFDKIYQSKLVKTN